MNYELSFDVGMRENSKALMWPTMLGIVVVEKTELLRNGETLLCKEASFPDHAEHFHVKKIGEVEEL